MKTFSQVWIEEDNGDNGHYECKLHDKEDCPYCTDVSIEKPLSWTIKKTPTHVAGYKSPLDEAMERYFFKGN
jgi:hypothetical protein